MPGPMALASESVLPKFSSSTKSGVPADTQPLSLACQISGTAGASSASGADQVPSAEREYTSSRRLRGPLATVACVS